MTGDDRDASSEFPSEIESVPPPATNEIDAFVDAVSAGGRPRVAIHQAEPADEMVFETEAVLSQQPVLLQPASLVQPGALRWVAASVVAFTFGGVLTWGVLRTFQSEPMEVAQNAIPPVSVPPLSRPARPPVEVLPRPAAVSRPPQVEQQSMRVAVSPAPKPAAVETPARITSPKSAATPPKIASIVTTPPIVRTPVPPPPAIVAPPVSVTEGRVAEAPAALALSLVPSPPPPAAPAAPNVIERSRALDEDAVREALQDYEHAYRTLDVVATADVWPSVDRRALARAFGTLKSQGLAFEKCDVKVAEASATARCRGTVQYVRKVGNSAPQVGRQEWLFKMRKLGSEWKIDEVTASQVSADITTSASRKS